jgi:hypothetical protein
MKARPESGPGMDGSSYLVPLALICLLLPMGQALAQDAKRVAAYDAAAEQNRSEIRFAAAEGSLVEFMPPFTFTCPKTSLVTIRIVHHDSVNVVPQTAPYTLMIPPGLRVYRDAAATIPIAAGQTLMTRATGYDTLWAGTNPDITMDQTYVLAIPSSNLRMYLTFVAGPSTTHNPIKKAEGPSSGSPLHDALGRKHSPKPRNPKRTDSGPATSLIGSGF